MFRINHNEAISLENLVCRVYSCDRSGISGMADADYFEGHPIQAAVLIVAYIHARGLEVNAHQYDEFLSKYEMIFEHPDENDAQGEVHNYIHELIGIVDDILRQL